jgi:hypothetical protein
MTPQSGAPRNRGNPCGKPVNGARLPRRSLSTVCATPGANLAATNEVPLMIVAKNLGHRDPRMGEALWPSRAGLCRGCDPAGAPRFPRCSKSLADEIVETCLCDTAIVQIPASKRLTSSH